MYGKIKRIRYEGGSSKNDLYFDYDPAGNRVAKHTYDNAGRYLNSVFYIRDAQGNVMSIYKQEPVPATPLMTYKLQEQHLYGSSRLGIAYPGLEMIGALNNLDTCNVMLGQKQYELSNHLGNVLTTVSDRKIALDLNADSVIDYYVGDIINATDYYPFGSPMYGRKWSMGDTYRQGFNGQEKDDEVYGAGNSNTAEFWQYDTRLGRRWNIDPVKKYWQGDYTCFSNTPLWKIDPNGDDDFFNADGTYSHSTKKGNSIKVITAKGTVKLSEYGTYDAAHRKAIGNIATYYAEKVGVKGQIGVKNNPEKKSSQNPAYTLGGKDGPVYLNSNDGISSSLDNYNNLTNVLWHEKNHQDGKGNSEYSFDHIDIYLKQIDEKSFKNTTDEFKEGLVGGAVGLLRKAATDELAIKGGLDETIKYVNEFNKHSKETGIFITVEREGQNTTGDTSDDKVTIKTHASTKKK